MFPSSAEVLPYVQIAAGVAAALGFFFTFLTFKRVGKTEQIKLVEKVNESLLTLDEKLSEIGDEDEDALGLWDARRFNTWEWYSYLVNKKHITDKKIKEYFKDGLINDFEEIFQKYASEETKNYAREYRKFKELYRKYKSEEEP